MEEGGALRIFLMGEGQVSMREGGVPIPIINTSLSSELQPRPDLNDSNIGCWNILKFEEII